MMCAVLQCSRPGPLLFGSRAVVANLDAVGGTSERSRVSGIPDILKTERKEPLQERFGREGRGRFPIRLMKLSFKVPHLHRWLQGLCLNLCLLSLFSPRIISVPHTSSLSICNTHTHLSVQIWAELS